LIQSRFSPLEIVGSGVKNIEPKARRDAVDLLPHRARITIDVDFSQLPVRCLSTLAIPGASTTAALLGLP
jgi:hypothetical protein